MFYAAGVADLQKRGSYAPRRGREQRAYRLVLTGGAAALIGTVSAVLWIVGLVGATLPVISLIVAVVCAVMFRNMTRTR